MVTYYIVRMIDSLSQEKRVTFQELQNVLNNGIFALGTF